MDQHAPTGDTPEAQEFIEDAFANLEQYKDEFIEWDAVRVGQCDTSAAHCCGNELLNQGLIDSSSSISANALTNTQMHAFLHPQSMADDWDPEDLMVPFAGYTPWSMVDYNTEDPTLKYTVSVDVAVPCNTCFRLFDDVLNWGEWFHIIHRVRAVSCLASIVRLNP